MVRGRLRTDSPDFMQLAQHGTPEHVVINTNAVNQKHGGAGLRSVIALIACPTQSVPAPVDIANINLPDRGHGNQREELTSRRTSPRAKSCAAEQGQKFTEQQRGGVGLGRSGPTTCHDCTLLLDERAPPGL